MWRNSDIVGCGDKMPKPQITKHQFSSSCIHWNAQRISLLACKLLWASIFNLITAVLFVVVKTLQAFRPPRLSRLRRLSRLSIFSRPKVILSKRHCTVGSCKVVQTPSHFNSSSSESRSSWQARLPNVTHCAPPTTGNQHASRKW